MTKCAVPGCDRTATAAAELRIASYHCRYHVQRRARHGSHWCTTYSAAELKLYQISASLWIEAHISYKGTRAALGSLDDLLRFAGPASPAMNLRGVSAAKRASVAFARLRESNVEAQRILAIFLGVAALIQDDLGSHRVREFRIVQVAKATHRLASGTHRRWEVWRPNGPPVHVEMHTYPKSSGLVLRRIGEAIEEACQYIPPSAVADIIAAKAERWGPHPSHLPGWRPAWQRQRLSLE